MVQNKLARNGGIQDFLSSLLLFIINKIVVIIFHKLRYVSLPAILPVTLYSTVK